MPKPIRNRHRQNKVLLQQPEFEIGQSVARVVHACGENNYEVEIEGGERRLYQLPKRLRHVTFIKRGSYVFVRNDTTRGPGKVCGDIETVVLDCFINELVKEPFWPTYFNPAQQVPEPFNSPSINAGNENRVDMNRNQTEELMREQKENEDESEEDEEELEWKIGMGNPNRGKWDHLSESKSSDESSDG